MITREADYAIRVALCLAAYPKGKLMSAMEISEKMFLPYRFSRKIISKFCKTGLIGASRGKKGGIFLLKPPKNISIHDILEIFDPKSLLFNSCYQEHNHCPRKYGCNVHDKMKSVQKKLNDKLKKITLAELSD